MSNLKELSELAWQGKLDTKFEHHPVHTFYEGSTELSENLLGLKGIGGFYVVDTNSGLVMIDAGSHLDIDSAYAEINNCLLYTSPSPRDAQLSRMPSSA